MAELKRKDELTTADLAGTNTNTQPEIERRPQLVRDELREENRFDNVSNSTLGTDSNLENRSINNDDSLARDNAFNPADRKVASINRADNTPSPLFQEAEVGDFRNRWSNIQTGFVDEPRRAVEDADSLVAQLMKKLAEGFASERASLEKQWDRGDNVSTEDLRVALQRYRSFFDRLLKI